MKKFLSLVAILSCLFLGMKAQTTVLWQSTNEEEESTENWRSVYTMSAEEAQETIGVGDYMLVTVSYVNPTGGWPQVAIKPPYGWPPYINEGVGGRSAECPFVVRFAITGPIAQQMYASGIGVSGGDVRISKVELEKATEELDPNTVWFGGKQCNWGTAIFLSKDLFANAVAGDQVVINYAPGEGATLQLLVGGWSGLNFPSYVGLPFFVKDEANNRMIFTLQPYFGAYEYEKDGETKVYDIFALLKSDGLGMHGPCYVNSILYIDHQTANLEAYEAAVLIVQALSAEWDAAKAEVDEKYNGAGNEQEAGAITAAIAALFNKLDAELQSKEEEGIFVNPVTEADINAIKAKITAWVEGAKKESERQIANMEAYNKATSDVQALSKEWNATKAEIEENYAGFVNEEEAEAISASIAALFTQIEKEYEAVATEGTFKNPANEEAIAAIKAKIAAWVQAAKDAYDASTIQTIAELKALPDGSTATFKANGTVVTFAMEEMGVVFMQDETGAFMGGIMEDSDVSFTAGTAVSGYFTVGVENGMIAILSAANVTAVEANVTLGKVVTEEELALPVNANRLVTVKAPEGQPFEYDEDMECYMVGNYPANNMFGTIPADFVYPAASQLTGILFSDPNMPMQSILVFRSEADILEASTGIVLWQSEDAAGVAPEEWSRVYEMTAEEAQEKIGVGDYLLVTVSYVNPEGKWPQVAIFTDLSWPPYANEGVSKDAECPLVVRFPITGPLAEQMHTNGFSVSGDDVRISKVELEKAPEELDPNTVWFGGKQCGWGNGIVLSNNIFATPLAGDKIVINYAPGEATLQVIPGGWEGPNFQITGNYPFFVKDEAKNQMIFTLQPDFGAYKYVKDDEETVYDIFELLNTKGLVMQGPCYVNSILYISDYERQSANKEAYEAAVAMVQPLFGEWDAAEAEVDENYPGFGNEEDAAAIVAAITALSDKIQAAYEAVAMEGTFVNPVTEAEIAAIKAQITAWVDAAKAEYERQSANMEAYEAAVAMVQPLYTEWAAAEAEVEENYTGFGDEEEAAAIVAAIKALSDKIQAELEATAEEGIFVNPVTEAEIAAIKARIAAWAAAAKAEYERQAANMEAYEAAEAMVQALYNEWAATEAEVEENYPGFGNEEDSAAISAAIAALFTKIQTELEATAEEGTFVNPVTEAEIAAIKAQITAWADAAKAEYERQSANMEAYEAAVAMVQPLYTEWAAAEAEVDENYPGFGDEEEAGAIVAAITALSDKIQAELEATAEEGLFVNPVTEEEVAAIKARIAAWVQAAKDGFSGINAILNGEAIDAEIFTTSGMKVAAPVHGQVNIVRLNGKTYKVQVK